FQDNKNSLTASQFLNRFAKIQIMPATERDFLCLRSPQRLVGLMRLPVPSRTTLHTPLQRLCSASMEIYR
ncbi:MAG: hypothetical protein WBF97_11600, partial [Comamonas sp.]